MKSRNGLSLGDSIGLLALVFAIFTFLVDPPPTIKLAMILCACVCTVIFIWASHWTYRLPAGLKVIGSGLAVGSLWTRAFVRVLRQAPTFSPLINLARRLHADLHTETARLLAAGALGALLMLVALTIFGALIVRLNARRSRPVPDKGFLDYKLQAEQAIGEFPSRLEPITKIVVNLGKLIETHATKLTGSEISDTQDYLKKLRNLARELDSYTKKLVRPSERLKSTAQAYSEGLTGWTDWMSTQPGYTPPKQQFVTITHAFIKSTLSGVQRTNEYLSRVALMRGVSKDLNYAVDRHAAQVTEIRDTLSAVIGASLASTGKLIPGYEEGAFTDEEGAFTDEEGAFTDEEVAFTDRAGTNPPTLDNTSANAPLEMSDNPT